MKLSVCHPNNVTPKSLIYTTVALILSLTLLSFYVKSFQGVNILSKLYETAFTVNNSKLNTKELYQHTSEVDLRIIILAYNRPKSLMKLLRSLNELHVDGDRAVIEIWIDRSKDGNKVSKETVECARNFTWNHGSVKVNVQPKHVSLYGQWVDSWKPSRSSKEIGLIIEDDLSVSPYAYRWLKAAHRKYGQLDQLSGITLQSEIFTVVTNEAPLKAITDRVAFLYTRISSFGLSPVARVWSDFREWFHKVSKDPNFHPYVDGIVATNWFKGFERSGRQDTMWEMWFIYFCHERNLLTLFSNLNSYLGNPNNCLIVHRSEPGVHYGGPPRNVEHNLLRNWSNDYVNFSRPIPMINNSGQRIGDLQP